MFVREDVEDDWAMEFDFVHLRMMFSCFNDARAVVQKVYDNLSPGGFMEYQVSLDPILPLLAFISVFWPVLMLFTGPRIPWYSRL